MKRWKGGGEWKVESGKGRRGRGEGRRRMKQQEKRMHDSFRAGLVC